VPELIWKDSYVYYGRREFGREESLQNLLEGMEKERVSCAVAAAFEQFYAPPDMANSWAGKAAGETPALYGLITMTPSCTGEMGAPESFITPKTAGFLLGPTWLQLPSRPIFLREWFSCAQERNVPVWYTFRDNADYEYVVDILAQFPNLTMVLFHNENWPNARKWFPLFMEYPNLYAGLSDLIWMGGIEAFVSRFGHRRLLYSSRYPEKYYGSSKLSLLRADIDEEAKVEIAGGNLARLLGGIVR